MINTLPQSLIESAKKILTESTISKHGELLSQWISSNDKFRDDPDDKSLTPESALSGMESRIREYAHNYPQYDVSNKDYELRHVPINSIVSKHQSELSKESADITAEQIRNSKSYKDLYRKHDVMPILLGHDMSVLDGHHRLDAAKTNGEKTIPALVPVSKGSGKVLNVAKPQINESMYNHIELPNTSDVKEMNKFIKGNSDIYVQKMIKLYHGTHPSHDIMNQGLLPTSNERRLSLQSGSGHVYLATTPEMAKQFGDIGNGINNSKVYEVSVPVHKLLPDKDQLKNKRMYGNQNIGDTIGDSIVHGKTVRVKGKINPWQIREYSND